MSLKLKFGLTPPDKFWQQSYERQHELLARIAEIGIDHIYMADHVSFRGGAGTDGFVEVAALSRMHPTLGVMISIYLLPLRHPLPVARQLATMHKIAPNRFLFGVGIGGDDRHELEVCGVDPGTRGRRTDESLEILRSLMHGDAIDYDGEIFKIENACIRPAIGAAIPILIGGRSNAALRRTARFGDGWIGVWCSPQRYTEAVELIEQQAREFGRKHNNWQHGYQPWVGVADTKAEARTLVAEAMEAFYKVPFENFERYVPYGSPGEVAAQLAPYVSAGCRLMNLKVVAGSNDVELAGAAEIRERLIELSD